MKKLTYKLGLSCAKLSTMIKIKNKMTKKLDIFHSLNYTGSALIQSKGRLSRAELAGGYN